MKILFKFCCALSLVGLVWSANTTANASAAAFVHKPASVADAPTENKPLLLMVEPLSRNGTMTDKQSPCGGYAKGMTHLLSDPGSTSIVQWKTVAGIENGTCRLRVSDGRDTEDSFTPLLPLDNSADDAGKFPCGRYGNTHETKTVAFPQDLSCEKCTLQVIWETSIGVFYSCGDITLMSEKNKACIGKCLNGGACTNGVCKCIEPFSGEYCQLASPTDSSSSSIWIVFLLLTLVIIGLLGAAYYFNNRRSSGALLGAQDKEVQEKNARQSKKVVEARRDPLGYEEQRSEPGAEGQLEEDRKAEKGPVEDPDLNERNAKRRNDPEAEPEAEVKAEAKPVEPEDAMNERKGFKRDPFGYEEQQSEPDNEAHKKEFASPTKDTCKNGHKLELSDSTADYPSKHYECASCGQRKKCEEGRWHCAECLYDICPDCKPFPEASPEQEHPAEPKQLVDPNSDTCFNGHKLEISDDATGYPGGQFICAACENPYPCSNKRWNCPICSYDICGNCKPLPVEESPQKSPEPIEEEKALPPVKEEESPAKQEESPAKPEESPAKPEESPAKSEEPEEVEPQNLVERVIESHQIEEAQGFKKMTGKKATWNKTHFVFAIDCSGSMKGTRWNSVKVGYKNCLDQLSSMKEVVVSTFTFDDKPNPHVKEKSPDEASKIATKLPFTGHGTNYKRALEHAINLVSRSSNPGYLSCVLFLSDGLGGFPEESIAQIKELKDQGLKMLFYTIACATEEDTDMIEMVKALQGEHYKFNSPEAAKKVFSQILGL